jgi:mRNA-degrading endonuclease RelE of RelBE toxin-antitoxin system
MPYNILLSRNAQKQLRKLPAHIAELIEQRLLILEENPRPPGCKKLMGRKMPGVFESEIIESSTKFKIAF